MKGSFGIILMILGILGIARAGNQPPQQSSGQIMGPGIGTFSIVTFAAVFLLVGGVLILAKSDGFSSGTSKSRMSADGDSLPSSKGQP